VTGVFAPKSDVRRELEKTSTVCNEDGGKKERDRKRFDGILHWGRKFLKGGQAPRNAEEKMQAPKFPNPKTRGGQQAGGKGMFTTAS